MIDEEHKQEIIRELQNEARDENYLIWKEEQEDYLIHEYIEQEESAFDDFCREEFRKWKEFD